MKIAFLEFLPDIMAVWIDCFIMVVHSDVEWGVISGRKKGQVSRQVC